MADSSPAFPRSKRRRITEKIDDDVLECENEEEKDLIFCNHSSSLVTDEVVQLSDSIFIYTNKKLSPHGNVFAGEIRNAAHNVQSCAIKLAQNFKQAEAEAKILTKLHRHTHIVPIIQSGIYGGTFEEQFYIVLEKCYEQNLLQYFEYKKEKQIVYDVNVGLRYSEQIIAGLKHIHEKLIFHKDLKPSNILLSHDRSRIKIADFGLSLEIKSTSSKVFCEHQFGTNGFRPPESFGGSWASLKSDIFSLGAVLYFLLSDGKSPFGDDCLLWTHNTQEAVLDLSHLLVSNPRATEHLIKLMLNSERCRRPSIWQVADHPCWAGTDIKHIFDYGQEEETADSDVQTDLKPKGESYATKIKLKAAIQFLKVAGNFNSERLPASEVSIVVFDRETEFLQLFNPKSKIISKMHEFNDEMKTDIFTVVSLDDYVFVLTQNRTTYRLKYCEKTATWEQMANMPESHGMGPPAVAASGNIIIAGGSYGTVTKLVSQYIPSLNIWRQIADKQIATKNSANVSSQGYVYCLGGFDGARPTNRAERLNIRAQVWDEVASMRETRFRGAAVEFDGNILLAGGMDESYQPLTSVEKFDPNSNQWTVMKAMNKGRWSGWFQCHCIDGSIYAVGPTNCGIEKYDPHAEEWQVVQLPKETYLDVEGSVAVKMTKRTQRKYKNL